MLQPTKTFRPTWSWIPPSAVSRINDLEETAEDFVQRLDDTVKHETQTKAPCGVLGVCDHLCFLEFTPSSPFPSFVSGFWSFQVAAMLRVNNVSASKKFLLLAVSFSWAFVGVTKCKWATEGVRVELYSWLEFIKITTTKKRTRVRRKSPPEIFVNLVECILVQIKKHTSIYTLHNTAMV